MEWKLELDQWICFMESIGHNICEILWNSEGLPEHLGKNMVLEEMKMYRCLCFRHSWDGTRWSSAKGIKRYCSFYSYSVIELTGYLHGYFIQRTSNQQPFKRSHTICFVTWIDVLQVIAIANSRSVSTPWIFSTPSRDQEETCLGSWTFWLLWCAEEDCSHRTIQVKY